MKYRNRLKVSKLATRLVNWFKSSIITFIKRDVPNYIANDVMKRLENEREITLPMCMGGVEDKGIVNYLNEYHNKKNHWDLKFLHIAFELTEERIRKRLSKFSDIEIETFNISDTDKRIVIKLI